MSYVMYWYLCHYCGEHTYLAPDETDICPKCDEPGSLEIEWEGR